MLQKYTICIILKNKMKNAVAEFTYIDTQSYNEDETFLSMPKVIILETAFLIHYPYGIKLELRITVSLKEFKAMVTTLVMFPSRKDEQ